MIPVRRLLSRCGEECDLRVSLDRVISKWGARVIALRRQLTSRIFVRISRVYALECHALLPAMLGGRWAPVFSEAV